MKSRTLSQDEIVLLAVNTIDSERIEASKKVLFELCPSSQRNISHKGVQKDTNNIKRKSSMNPGKTSNILYRITWKIYPQ